LRHGSSHPSDEDQSLGTPISRALTQNRPSDEFCRSRLVKVHAGPIISDHLGSWFPTHAQTARMNGAPSTQAGAKTIVFSATCGTAEEAAEKVVFAPERLPSGAKAHSDFGGLMYGLKPVPFTGASFSAACEVVP